MSKYTIHSIISHDFHANTYVVEGQNACMIIDAGASIEQIKSVCQKPVQAVFITHAHFDHIWYLEQYATAFNCPIYLSKEACDKLTNPDTNLSSSFCEKQLRVFLPEDRLIKIDNSLMVVDSIDIRSFVTKGHSNCSLSFVLGKDCFCGDLLFEDGIGRTDFEDGNIVSLYKSMKNLLAMDCKTFYPGHGFEFFKEDFVSNFNKKNK